MAVKMYKTESNLRKEDDVKQPLEHQTMVDEMPKNPKWELRQQLNMPTPVAKANFIENINNGLAIGGSNGNLNTQIPQSMDTMGASQLTQQDIEKILSEI